MGNLLVRAMFGERVVGRFVLQSGKRSSENGVQTTLLSRKKKGIVSLEKYLHIQYAHI